MMLMTLASCCVFELATPLGHDDGQFQRFAAVRRRPAPQMHECFLNKLIKFQPIRVWTKRVVVFLLFVSLWGHPLLELRPYLFFRPNPQFFSICSFMFRFKATCLDVQTSQMGTFQDM